MKFVSSNGLNFRPNIGLNPVFLKAIDLSYFQMNTYIENYLSIPIDINLVPSWENAKWSTPPLWDV